MDSGREEKREAKEVEGKREGKEGRRRYPIATPNLIATRFFRLGGTLGNARECWDMLGNSGTCSDTLRDIGKFSVIRKR